MASQVSCNLCVDGVGWDWHYLVLCSSGYELKMHAKISDPSRYENFGVRNILDLQYPLPSRLSVLGDASFEYNGVA